MFSISVKSASAVAYAVGNCYVLSRSVSLRPLCTDLTVALFSCLSETDIEKTSHTCTQFNQQPTYTSYPTGLYLWGPHSIYIYIWHNTVKQTCVYAFVYVFIGDTDVCIYIEVFWNPLTICLPDMNSTDIIQSPDLYHLCVCVCVCVCVYKHYIHQHEVHNHADIQISCTILSVTLLNYVFSSLSNTDDRIP